MCGIFHIGEGLSIAPGGPGGVVVSVMLRQKCLMEKFLGGGGGARTRACSIVSIVTEPLKGHVKYICCVPSKHCCVPSQ